MIKSNPQCVLHVGTRNASVFLKESDMWNVRNTVSDWCNDRCLNRQNFSKNSRYFLISNIVSVYNSLFADFLKFCYSPVPDFLEVGLLFSNDPAQYINYKHVSWIQANKQCQAHGSHLVTLHSYKEVKIIVDSIVPESPLVPAIFIGLRREVSMYSNINHA